ncbi:hypothetical protein TNCV_2774491 [Trichonephila clavipes]|nr:hypothetical protein TNCV_2774491 [Trichonephila clavipes]
MNTWDYGHMDTNEHMGLWTHGYGMDTRDYGYMDMNEHMGHASVIHTCLRTMYGAEVMSRRMVSHRCYMFKEDRKQISRSHGVYTTTESTSNPFKPRVITEVENSRELKFSTWGSEVQTPGLSSLQWINKMSTKLVWELAVLRPADHQTGTSAHALQGSR